MNIKRSSMEYNEKIMRELFNYVRYQMYVIIDVLFEDIEKMNQDQTKNLFDYIMNLF